MSTTKQPKLEVVPPLIADAADLSDLWMDPALGDGLTDTIWHSVPVGKPRDFFRVHPSSDWRRRTEVYVHKPEGAIDEQVFIVARPMWGKIAEARPALIATCISRDGSPRLWPLKFAKADEKDNEAWVSARNAARDALTAWVRLVWVQRAYQTRQAQEGFAPEPDWSKLPSFDELVRIALGPSGIIRDVNHPAYRDLMGTAPQPASKVADDDF